METMNIALPESLKTFRYLRSGASCQRWLQVSEYIRELIRSDQKHRLEERIDALLLDGINSGDPVEVTPTYWEAKKQKLAERLAKANGK